MTSEEVHFSPHKLGVLKIEGEPYQFFRQWDTAKNVPRYWLTRDGTQNMETMEKTGGSNAVWYKNGTRLNLNTSAMLNSMERDYRVAKDILSAAAGGNGDSAVSEETETIKTPKDASQQAQAQEKPKAPQPPAAAKTNAPAKNYERIELGTLSMDGDNYRVFRTWKQSNIFGSYAYERYMEGSKKSEAIYKSAATGRALWSNFSGRELGTAVSNSLSSLDDRAGYEDLQNYKPVMRNFDKPHKAQQQKKPKATANPQSVSASRIAILKAAQEKAAPKHARHASRAPRQHREIGEAYEDGGRENEVLKPPFYRVDVFTDDTGLITDTKWIKDPAETYETIMGIKKARADEVQRICIRYTPRKGYDQDISIGVLKKIISDQASKQERARRTPRQRREITESYEDVEGETDTRIFDDEGPALTYSDIKRKGLLDL